ncbi:MAG: winged helix-turn-helix transcriptional regulator [Nitrososphaerales archaeon]
MSIKNQSRAKIIELVSMLPGIHLRELQRTLGVSFNSIRYNTDLLSRSGEIICERTSGYSRLYPVGTSESDKLVYSAIRNRTTRRILVQLGKSAQLTNKELTEHTGLAKSTISEHVHALLLSNLVRLTLSDGGFKIQLQEPARVNLLLAKSEQLTRQNDVVGSFTDLWDF